MRPVRAMMRCEQDTKKEAGVASCGRKVNGDRGEAGKKEKDQS
jgi:hypothetical protein